MYQLIRRVRELADITMLKFVLVGLLNTLVGSAIMFAAYNLLHFSYWVSSAMNYIFGSILSYFLNKNFTFQNKTKGWKPVLRFTVNIVVCYAIAYGVARPLTRLALSGMGQTWQDNGAMLVGMCLFVAVNYFGQRFFAFRD